MFTSSCRYSPSVLSFLGPGLPFRLLALKDSIFAGHFHYNDYQYQFSLENMVAAHFRDISEVTDSRLPKMPFLLVKRALAYIAGLQKTVPVSFTGEQKLSSASS